MFSDYDKSNKNKKMNDKSDKIDSKSKLKNKICSKNTSHISSFHKMAYDKNYANDVNQRLNKTTDNILPSQIFIKYLNKWRCSQLNENECPIECTHYNMCPPFGKFAIPQGEMSYFFKLYQKELENGCVMGLIEKPLPHMEMPLVIDIDLKYLFEGTETNLRKHNYQTIKDVLRVYKRVYDKHFFFQEEEDKNSAFWVVTQREKPYICESDNKKIVKDGWHVINPMIRAFPNIHLAMREEVLKDEKLPFVFSSLGATEPVSAIIDKSVIEKNGWLLYGSTKPGKTPYRLSNIFDMELNEVSEACLNTDSLPYYLSYWRKTIHHAIPREYIFANQFEKDLFYNKEIEQKEEKKETEEEKEEKKEVSEINPSDAKEKKTKKKKSKKEVKIEVVEATSTDDSEGGIIEKLRILIGMLSKKRAKNRVLWLEIGTCLKAQARNESEMNDCFQLWEDFTNRYGVDEDCENEWEYLPLERAADLATLKYWAKKDNKSEYLIFKQNEIRQFLIKIINNTHYDVAQTLYLLYESEFVCSSVKNNTWYQFENNRWHEIEIGISLRDKISNELAKEYSRFHKFCLQVANDKNSLMDENKRFYCLSEEVVEELEAIDEDYWFSMAEIAESIIPKLKNKSYKDAIMSEAKGLFYNKDFEQKLNERHELIGFENGVMDLEQNIFREGRPDDYITFSTKSKYIENHEEKKEYKEIMTFLKQIYLKDEMVHYILKERAQMLHGDNTEERIFAWIGDGGNGKSKFRDLNLQALGDYVFSFPVTLFTGRRTQSSAATPEVARGKGKRMAFVDEPEMNQSLNVGLLKKFSGGDPIETRKLFGDMFEFIPQFSITILCNDPPKVPPHDDGTRRRLTCDPHNSRFVDKPNPNKENEFEKDRLIPRKIKKWKNVYASMLIKYYYIYQEEGLNPPNEVMKFTENFFKECDVYDSFFLESLIEVNEKEESKKESVVDIGKLYETFKNWIEDNGHRRTLTKTEFRKYLTKKVKSGSLRQNKIYGYKERENEDCFINR
jgi:P4 family phage/plasmid primase-like protien